MSPRLVVALLLIGAAALALTEALPWIAWPTLTTVSVLLGLDTLAARRHLPPVTPADIAGHHQDTP